MIKDSARDASIALPPLPYAYAALAPHISADTLALHHGKHHGGYVEKLRALIVGTKFAAMSLDDIVVATAGDPESAGIFNQAAQAWNHAFHWRSLTPAGKDPTGPLAARIARDFGGLAELRRAFIAKATAHFGSGWAWLVWDGAALKVESTANADTPHARGVRCLLTVDVWEHAYYLDYRNRREDYVRACVDHLLNWEFAAANFAGVASRTD